MTEKKPENLKPWELQPGETVKAFQAWTEYRDMAEPNGSELARIRGVSESVVKVWMHRWRWTDRRKAWVSHLDEVKRKDQVNEIHDMNRRHANLAKAMLALVARQLNELGQKQAGHKVLKPFDINMWLAGASKVERLARGQPTDKVGTVTPGDTDPTTANLDNLSTEELEQLDRILAGAAKRAAAPK